MIGFDLLRPGLAWLLCLAPLAFLVGWFALARSRAELARWVLERYRERFLPGASPARARLRLALGALGLFFLALAALGPVRGYTYRSVSKKSLDLVVCLDTSRSMLAQDLRPSRLERAKREVLGLLDHLKGDRVALVAFSGDARDVAPLTRDRQTLEHLLAFVTPEDNQEGGTNLAAAIEHALGMFDGRTGAHEAVVLLTDGEDLEGKAAAESEEALKRGIRLFIVGVGTEAGGKIPVVDASGNSSFLRDPDGNEVVTKLDRESLATLAARTGGEFLSAEESPTALEDLYRARITRMQGREVEGGERRVPYDRFQWPLALGVLCLVAEFAVRARSARRAARASDARLAAAWLPLCLLFPQEPFSPARSLASAVFHHRAGEPEAAENAAQAILEQADALQLDDLARGKAHFALGVIRAARVLDGAEEADKLSAQAVENFSAARALVGPGELRNDATYDLGALTLFHAEAVRATIPEVSGQPAGGAPGGMPSGIPGLPPGAAPGAAPDAAPPPDPLKVARALYLEARTWLVERLQLEWQDEDTRANLELIQRRLHQLDEIEKKREEEKQKDQDQNKDQQGDDKDDKNKDKQDQDQQDKDQKQDQKDSDSKSDQDQQQDSKPGDENPDDKDTQKKPEDQDPSQEQKDQQQEPEQKDEKPGEEQKPEEGKPGDQAQQPQAAQPSEQVLTKEEVMQLLDKLQDLEKKQKALEAAVRARRRAATKRDW